MLRSEHRKYVKVVPGDVFIDKRDNDGTLYFVISVTNMRCYSAKSNSCWAVDALVFCDGTRLLNTIIYDGDDIEIIAHEDAA